MANNGIPYLCCGTFLTQVLRARGELKSAADYEKGEKESLSEQETLRRLVSVFRLSDFAPAGGSLKTYTTHVKTCGDSHESYFGFCDYDLRREFDEDVRSGSSTAIYLMSEFVKDFIDPDKYEQLVRCLLGLILDDEEIEPNEVLLIRDGGKPVAKSELLAEDGYHIEAFLLGVWHYVIMNRHGDNGKGAATYQQWYKGRNNYTGKVGDRISQRLEVSSVPAENPVKPDPASEDRYADGEVDEELDEDVATESQDNSAAHDEDAKNHSSQYIGRATVVNQYGEKNVHIDHVGILNL